MADISGYLTNIKNAARGEDVRDSIISALKKINQDNPADVQPLNVTANGTYSGQGGIVYNPVTVNVPEGASQALSLSDLKVTENGEYTPEDGEAYRKIIVEVPQQVMEIMDVKTIYLEEGAKDYFALDDGYDGYAQVSVVSGGGGGGGGATYNVDFMAADHTTLLERVTGVPFGGGAVYHKPEPTSSGMRFVGWSPNPLNIRANTVCYPRFENIIYNPTQIQDTWADIAKKCHEDPDAYDIGMWKAMEFVEWRDTWNITIPSAMVYMQLVAKGVDKIEGENGYANTTWIIANESPRCLYGDRSENVGAFTDNTGTKYGWPGGRNRQRYQSDQFVTQIFPQEVIQYVKRVIKYSGVSIGQGSSIYSKSYPSVDYFWAPSSHEVLGGCTNYPNAIYDNYGINYSWSEDTGPVYDALFGSGTGMVDLQSHRATNGWAWSTRTPCQYGVTIGCDVEGKVSTAFDARTGFRLGFCI